jgi:DUF4097 and DUF4098 domain-containing protein YvlB
MKFRTLLAFSLFLPVTSALAADGTFDKTLSVSVAPSLSVSTGSGYIHVYSGSDRQVHITGHVHSRAGAFDSNGEARVKEIVASPPITQTGNTIVVANVHQDSGLFNNISIDYDITTPGLTNLNAQTGSGSLEVGGIQGKVSANSGSGSIHGDNIGNDARFLTGSGSIRATNVHGAAVAQTGSGRIELSISGPGDVKAQTGSGSIRLDGIGGGLRAAGTGSGSIEVAGNPTSEWRLETGSGSIRVETKADAHFNLNAEAGSGFIHVDHPIVMQDSMNRHHVTGIINGGGPTVHASTSSGSITIR